MSVSLKALTRDTNFFSRWLLIQRSIIIQHTKNKRLRNAPPKWDIFTYLLLPRLSNHHGRTDRESVRVRGHRLMLSHSVFWVRRDCCIHELLVTVPARAQPVQDQAKQKAWIGKVLWSSTLTREDIGNWWLLGLEERVFFGDVTHESLVKFY